VENKGYALSGQINEVPDSDTIALFFHGSGIQDRWATMPAENTFDGKPAPIFKAISDDLNRRGVSTLVYDKRGYREKGTPSAGAAAKTATFENIKSDALVVLGHLESLGKFKNIILIGHSEGTVVASEISFARKADPFLKKILLIGVLAENLRDSLRYQLTEGMAESTFREADKNGDWKIYPGEIPPQLKSGLPIDKIDKQRKGYITRADLLAVLTDQFNGFLVAIAKAPQDSLVMNKPVQWYRELMGRKTLLQRAKDFTLPTTIFHGKIDKQVLFDRNASPLFRKMEGAGKVVQLKTFPEYGHCLSPEKDGLPTLGPIQGNAIHEIVSAALSE
jgi:alpha-beta hydrolase superfamily lysophospholipase